MKDLRSKGRTEKKRVKRKRVFLLIPAIFLLFFGLYMYYAYAERFHVIEVDIPKTAFVPKNEVAEKIENILSEKVLGLIPDRSPLLIDKSHIKDVLLAAFPSIKEVAVEITDNILYVDITERTASSVVCTESAACYFMDDEGLAFARAPQFEGNSFIRIQTYEHVEVGKNALNPEELRSLIKTVATFKSLGITIEYIAITSDHEAQYISSNDTMFIVNRKDAIEAIEERLHALASSRPDIASGKYTYIDLRIDSKIFLKNRES